MNLFINMSLHGTCFFLKAVDSSLETKVAHMQNIAFHSINYNFKNIYIYTHINKKNITVKCFLGGGEKLSKFNACTFSMMHLQVLTHANHFEKANLHIDFICVVFTLLYTACSVSESQCKGLNARAAAACVRKRACLMRLCKHKPSALFSGFENVHLWREIQHTPA